MVSIYGMLVLSVNNDLEQLSPITVILRDKLIAWFLKKGRNFFSVLTEPVDLGRFKDFRDAILKFTAIPWPEDRIERIANGDKFVSHI